jgi:hypothetical protein
MVFVLRKPKLPCIAFAGDHAFAAFKYADLDKIVGAVNGDSFQIQDREGMEFDYFSERRFLAPAFTMGPIKKKDLVAKVFESENMTHADPKLRDRNLNNIRLDDLVAKLAAEIKAQALKGDGKQMDSSPKHQKNMLAG